MNYTDPQLDNVDVDHDHSVWLFALGSDCVELRAVINRPADIVGGRFIEIARITDLSVEPWGEWLRELQEARATPEIADSAMISHVADMSRPERDSRPGIVAAVAR